MPSRKSKLSLLLAAAPLMLGVLAFSIGWVADDECVAALRQTTGSPDYPHHLYVALQKDCARWSVFYRLAQGALAVSLPLTGFFLWRRRRVAVG